MVLVLEGAYDRHTQLFLYAAGQSEKQCVRQVNDIQIGPLDSVHGNHSAGEMFATWSFETDQPLSLERLREMVRRELPASVYRCKGILYSYEQPGTRFALQIVGRRTEINELDSWGERRPHTKIVAIGSASEIEPDSLTALFESCIHKPEVA